MSSRLCIAYFAKHDLNRLFQDMKLSLKECMPASPYEFLLNGLSEIRRKLETTRSRKHLVYREVFSRGHFVSEKDLKCYVECENNADCNVLPLVPHMRRGSVSAECMPSPIDDNGRRVVIEKRKKVRDCIEKAVSKNMLFRDLDLRPKSEIIDLMFEKRVREGEYILKQGYTDDCFYVIENGTFDIIVNEKKKGEYHDGESFGELSLMHNSPGDVSVQATTNGIVWIINRMTFRKIITSYNYKNRKLYEGILRSAPILKNLPRKEISNIADRLEKILFKNGDVVVRQNEIGECFYIVLEGELKVLTRKKGGQEIEMGRLKKGNYFGEMALLKKVPRFVTVISVGDSTCLMLNCQTLTMPPDSLIGDIERSMEKHKRG